VFDVLPAEQHAEASVAIAGAVVGERAAAGEAEAREVGAGHVEEKDRGGVFLVGQDGGERQPAVIVDRDVEVLVAGAPSLARAISVDAMTRLDDAGHALDIEVDQVAGPFMLIAHNGRRGIERAQPVHAGPAHDAADSGPAEPGIASDPPAVVAQSAKSQNLFY